MSMCVVVWNVQGVYNWYLGYVKDQISDNCYLVDHLQCVQTKSNLFWKYPNTDDTKKFEIEKMIPVKVDGKWNVTSNIQFFKFKFTLRV